MCLSDGMGSGMEACRESEEVVELLEQFLESGFSQETAAKMVNSACDAWAGRDVFHRGYLCSGSVYRNLQFFKSRGFFYLYKKRSLGGSYFLRKPCSRTDTAD